MKFSRLAHVAVDVVAATSSGGARPRRALAAGQLPATRAWRTPIVSRRARLGRAWTSAARARARVAARARGRRAPSPRVPVRAPRVRDIVKSAKARESSPRPEELGVRLMPASATARASSSSSRAALSSRPRRARRPRGRRRTPFSTKGARGKDADCPRFASARGTTRPREGIGPSVAPKPTSIRGASSSRACPSRWTRPSIASHAHSTRRRRGVMRCSKRCLFLKQTLFVSHLALLHLCRPQKAACFCFGLGGSSNARVVSGSFSEKGHIYRFLRLRVYNFDIERGF